jgi:putative ABC transport system permease protein
MLASLRVAAFLAVKSIVRGNIGVTLLTILILILIALNLLFVPGLSNGLVMSANEQLINNYSSNVIINPRGRDTQINHVAYLIEQTESLNGVVAATARNNTGAILKYKDNQGDERRINTTIYGSMPEKEKKVFEVSSYLIEGTSLEPRDRNQILLGIQLAGADDQSVELYARSLRQVHAGDKVTVTYSNGVVREYKVKGIFRTGFIQTDLQAFISDVEYESVIPSADDMASSIHVKLKDNVASEEIIARMKKFRDDVEFQTWEQNAGIVNSMTTSFYLINEIINMVNALVAGITIFIVTYVDVINRRRQIGILRAIGIKAYPIISSYLVRALFYVFVGLIVSWLLFVYIIMPLESDHPLHFPFGPVFLTFNFPLLCRTAVMLSATSLVAAFIPVWLVLRIKIMDAIWG